MLEKLTCCLAHPMTALRTLKNKINEVITAHNELVNKVDNLPAGGGGGGGSSEPVTGGAGVAILNASCQFDPQNRVLSDGVGFTPFTKLAECYEGGGLVWCRLSLMMGDMLLGSLECAPVSFEGNLFNFQPIGAMANSIGDIIVTFMDDDSVNVSID